MNWREDYESKFKSAEEAVAVVRDGDQVVYGEFAMASMTLDAAFAARVPQLHDISLPLPSGFSSSGRWAKRGIVSCQPKAL